MALHFLQGMMKMFVDSSMVNPLIESLLKK